MLEKKLIVAILTLSLSATSVQAAGLYLGVGLSGNGEAGSFRQSLERFAEADDNPWKAFAGWRFGEHLAVEVSRYDFGTQHCCDEVADVGFHSEVDGYSAALLGRWPLGRWTPFVKAGALYWKEDGAFITLAGPSPPRSDDGTDLLVGAGVDVDLPARFTVRADWERYEFGSVHSDGFWASLLYRF